jgi:hypothetical protein
LDSDRFLFLKAEIEKELDNIQKLRNEIKSVQGLDSILSKRAIGSILHDFYNGCERIFKAITFDVNGGFDLSEKWHKALLFKATIHVKDVRPAIISEELAAELDDYLSFRHVFRNIYGFELKGERINQLKDKFDRTAERFIQELTNFIDLLEDYLADS